MNPAAHAHSPVENENFGGSLFRLTIDVSLLTIALGVFVDIFEPGALLAPFGKIFYRLNSKLPTTPLGKSLNCDI